MAQEEEEEALVVWGVNLDHIFLEEEYGKNRLRATALLRASRAGDFARTFSGQQGCLTKCCRRLRDGRYETLGAVVRDVHCALTRARSDYGEECDIGIMAKLTLQKFKDLASSAIRHGDFVATPPPPPPTEAPQEKERKKPGPKPRRHRVRRAALAATKGIKRRSQIKLGEHSAKLAKLCEESWLSALECCAQFSPQADVSKAQKSFSQIGQLFCDLDPNEDSRVAAKRLLCDSELRLLPPHTLEQPTTPDETMAQARNLWLPIIERLVRSLARDFRNGSARSRLAADEFWKLTAAIEREERSLEKLRHEPSLERKITDRQLASMLRRITERHARLCQVLVFKRLIRMEEEDLDLLAECCSAHSRVHAHMQSAAGDDRRRLRELRVVNCSLLLARRHLLVVYLDSRLDHRLPPACVKPRTSLLLSILQPWQTAVPPFLSSTEGDDCARSRRRLLADFQPLTMADAGLDFIQLRLRHKPTRSDEPPPPQPVLPPEEEFEEEEEDEEDDQMSQDDDDQTNVDDEADDDEDD